jgi:hypothetical protein
MGANMSRQRVAAHIRAQPVAAYAGWILVARCERCPWTGARPIEMLPARWMDATIGAVIERLACTGCSQRPAAVQLRRGGKRLSVLGPGSY